jgi:hypothetical protein
VGLQARVLREHGRRSLHRSWSAQRRERLFERGGIVLIDKFLNADSVKAIVADHRRAGLSEIDVAVMDLAEKVAADASSVQRADVDRLRSLGLSDKEVGWPRHRRTLTLPLQPRRWARETRRRRSAPAPIAAGINAGTTTQG